MKWFAGALFLLLAALMLESGLLAYAMYVLLGLLVISRLLTRTWINGLSANRTCDRETAEIGEEVNVDVVVRNDGMLPVPWVLLEDMLPAEALIENRNRLRVRKKRLKIAMLRSYGETTLNYQIEFKGRGYYQLGRLVLEGGLIVTASALSVVHRELIITLAARHKLPAVYYRRIYVTDGGLISHGPDLAYTN